MFTEPFYKVLDETVDNMASSIVFRDRNFSSNEFVQEFAAVKGQKLNLCCGVTADFPPPVSLASLGKGKKSGNPTENKITQLLAQYCGDCHGDGSSLPIANHSIENLSPTVARKILQRLDWENCETAESSMPPTGEYLNDICTVEGRRDRQDLLRSIGNYYFPKLEHPCGPEATRDRPGKEFSRCPK